MMKRTLCFFKNGYTFEDVAFQALMVAVTSFLVDFFFKLDLVAAHAGRKTVMPKDVALLKALENLPK